MGLLARIFGICKTKSPADSDSWTYSDGKVIIESDRVPEILKPNGAIRLEGKGLSQRILLLNGDNGKFYAFGNTCSHMGRRLDHLVATKTVQCCSISKSTYDYAGNVVSGPAKNPLITFPIDVKEDQIIIFIE